MPSAPTPGSTAARSRTCWVGSRGTLGRVRSAVGGIVDQHRPGRGESAECPALDRAKNPEGKARSAQNANKHGFAGRLLVGLQYGPSVDDPAELQAFVQAVLAELDPRGAQEQAEALNIAGLYVRRGRLVELEAMALAHGTRTRLLPPERPGMPARVAQEALTEAGANALSTDLFDRLPRNEGHLSRELDRSLARYAGLQEARKQREQSLDGELVPPARPATGLDLLPSWSTN